MTYAWRKPTNAGGWMVALLGLIFVLIGLSLAIGGAILVTLGGSPYYLLAGLAMIVSGVLLALRHALGAWLYIALFVATVLWAFWEVGTDGWALIPRLVGPIVLLLLVVAALPVLGVVRWRPALGAVAGCALVALLGGVLIARSNPARIDALPPVGASLAGSGTLATGADWPAYGGTYDAQRYSPLSQINLANVGQLKRAWEYHTGDLPTHNFGAETTPLKIGDTLYLCSARNILIALDARSGKERWRQDPKVSDASIPYTAACRGVAYYAVPNADPATLCATRIIEGTLDARIIAVDARTGAYCPGFGKNGQVDHAEGMDSKIPGMVSITSAPTIVKGVIVSGHQVLDGQYKWAPSGVIKGYDAVTGALRWAWDMRRPDIAGLPPAGQSYTRGTPNMWTTASGDEALGLVYLPMGNSAADYVSSMRTPEEDRYATSLVAIDATTGKPAWHFQAVRNDVWDYDMGSQATLIDFPTSAGPVPALVLPTKQGDIYVLDRRTGKPLTALGEVRAPGGGVEPDQRAATQPVSLYHTLRYPDLTERDMWGMSLIDQMICRIQFRKASYKGFYTPPEADRPAIQYPGYNGGSDWGGIAIDPRRGVIVANYNDMPNYNRLVPRAEANHKGWFPRGDPRAKTGGAEGAGDPQMGAPYAINVNAGWRLPFTGLLCKQPPYGGIRAIDLRTGHTIWDRPLGTARRNGPFGIASGLPIEIGTPNSGGSVVTAGGLIFIAAATDDLIRAIDIKTGKTVWQDALPAGGQANPMIYAIDGREYLVIMAGGHHFMETPIGDSVIAYALPSGS